VKGNEATAPDGMTIAAADLRAFAAEILLRTGMAPDDAGLAADVIVDANLRGVDTHGAFLLTIYARRLRLGLINPSPHMRFERRRAAVGVLDADHGMGHVATARAMEQAIALARESGVASVLVIGSNHFGAAAYYVRMAAEQGCIGMVFSPAEASVVPFGGRQRFFGTNPIAVATPPGHAYPGLTLDMATSAVAGGKVHLAGKTRKTIPEGWAIDPQGRPVTAPSDDDDALRSYLLLPLGGAKGYGLAATVEWMTSLLGGTQWGPQIVRWTEDWEHQVNLSHYVQAIDVEAFEALDAYRRRVGDFCAALKSVAPANGFDEVLLPGEPELRAARERTAEGCPLSAYHVRVLSELGASLGVPFPPPASGPGPDPLMRMDR